MAGRIVLVGAGPGDPGLLTLRGKWWLERADVVVYDYLANPALLEGTRPDAELFLVGKHGGGPRVEQEEIHRLMIGHALRGKLVVRLKGGDPFIFGRGGEELEAAKNAGIAVEVVPGVTAAIAVPAYAGIPLTHREMASSVSFVAGYQDPQKSAPMVRWETFTDPGQTLVILMTQRQLRRNAEQLIAAGRAPETPVAVVESGTRAGQRTVTGTLADIAEKAEQAEIRPPALAVVGAVVGLRHRLQWFEQKPLAGRLIVVTRPRLQAASLIERLEAEGAEVLPLPTIEIVRPPSYVALDDALRRAQEFDWLVFTSVNGVRAFFTRLRDLALDIREWHRARIAAIGAETKAELERFALRVDVVPDDYRAEGLAQALLAHGMAGKRVLLPRAEGARAVLVEELARGGATVEEVVAYRSVMPRRLPQVAQLIEALEKERVDLVVFSSSSTVRNFVELLHVHGLSCTGLKCAAIGPITAQAAQASGMEVVVQPQQYTAISLAAALVAYFARHREEKRDVLS